MRNVRFWLSNILMNWAYRVAPEFDPEKDLIFGKLPEELRDRS
jgi:hypothetical protein